METFWWILTCGMVVAGLIGTVLPFVPGSVLLWLGVVLHFFLLPGGLGWGTLLGITFLMLLSQVVDFLSGAAGAKWFGATRWGVIGGILGAVIGIFFGLLGLLLGPVIGALLGELLAGRGLIPAGKSSFGTVLGAAAGLALKLLLAFLMAGWFAIALLLAPAKTSSAGAHPQCGRADFSNLRISLLPLRLVFACEISPGTFR